MQLLQSNGQIITLVVFLLAIPITLLYDLWVDVKYGNDATISKSMLSWTNKYPTLRTIVLVGLGVLLGHLFAYQSLPTP